MRVTSRQCTGDSVPPQSVRMAAFSLAVLMAEEPAHAPLGHFRLKRKLAGRLLTHSRCRRRPGRTGRGREASGLPQPPSCDDQGSGLYSPCPCAPPQKYSARLKAPLLSAEPMTASDWSLLRNSQLLPSVPCELLSPLGGDPVPGPLPSLLLVVGVSSPDCERYEVRREGALEPNATAR